MTLLAVLNGLRLVKKSLRQRGTAEWAGKRVVRPFEHLDPVHRGSLDEVERPTIGAEIVAAPIEQFHRRTAIPAVHAVASTPSGGRGIITHAIR